MPTPCGAVWAMVDSSSEVGQKATLTITHDVASAFATTTCP